MRWDAAASSRYNRGMVELARLNDQARERAIRLDDVDWAIPIDHTRQWVPPELHPLTHTATWERLEPDEALAANQMYGLALAEQFVLLEEHLLNRVVESIQAHAGYRERWKDEPALLEALEHLHAEETVHSEMFWRLCEHADPESYRERRFRLIPVTRFSMALLRGIFSFPAVFPFWCWVGAIFEEKTISFARSYAAAGDAVDPTFARVHHLHMLDEVRHCALEHELVGRLWRDIGPIRRSVNLWAFATFLKNFTRPSRSILLRFDVLSERFPRLRALRPELARELRALPHNASWLEASFSPRVLPGCFKLFDAYPEVGAVVRDLVGPVGDGADSKG